VPANAQSLHAPQTSQTASILDGIVKIPINAEEDPIQACNRLLANSDVIYAEPIVANYLLQTPADPFLEDQYYLDNIRAFDAWNITRGDDDIAIAVIDSGTDLDHDDLQDNLWTNINDPFDGIDNDNNGLCLLYTSDAADE